MSVSKAVFAEILSTTGMWTRKKTIIQMAALLASTISSSIAQQQQPNRPAVLENNLPIEGGGPDDLLLVTVNDMPELTRSYRIGKDGCLTIPSLKEPLPVAGLTPTAISKKIAQAIVRQQILVDPVVSVQVAEYRSHLVTVAGAVKLPGQVQVAGHMTLLDAIAAAQGVLPEAGPVVILTTANPVTRISILLKQLMETPTPDINPVLRGGEEIQVPEAAKVYVMGNVKRPGAFAIRDGRNTTVLKILAECEGTLPFSKGTAYIYRQTGDSQTRTEIPVQLGSLLARKSPDVPLFGSDIFYVPDQKSKHIAAQVLDRIAQFGSSASSQAVILK